jgi:hypothetical protein
VPLEQLITDVDQRDRAVVVDEEADRRAIRRQRLDAGLSQVA